MKRMNDTYKVKLDMFEGPLDLLLHLIKELEIDIYDISVATITEQYMNYIHAMQEIELNIASEYLVMAATLIEMKSAMLLPKKEIAQEDDEYEEDPREALISRLIEYRKYKHAAEELKMKELDENQLYTRTPIQFDVQSDIHTVTKGDVSVYDMIQALHKVFERKKWNEPLETKIDRMEISIEERMEEILKKVYISKQPITFDDLFPYPNRTHIVTTFLAILQLLKSNHIYCEQKNHFQPIYISRMEA